MRKNDLQLGFVPTMGALDEGHISLVKIAQKASDGVSVSNFVNPTQFENLKDLQDYPNTLSTDLEQLRRAGVMVVFLPAAAEIYAEDAETTVETTRLAHRLLGAVRPGHFGGVTTVVSKLFNIVQPYLAVFGEKDYQQLHVIRRMVRDLHIPVKIMGAPVFRESDGLAMSSRNRRLGAADCTAACVLCRALDRADRLATKGLTIAQLRQDVTNTISAEARATVQSVDLCATETLADLSGPITGSVALMISATFGETLLIDQRIIGL